MTADVTCAWCHGDVGFGESHGDGVCVVSVPFEIDTTRIDAALDRMRVFARGQLGHLPVDTPASELRLSADTHLVSPPDRATR